MCLELVFECLFYYLLSSEVREEIKDIIVCEFFFI